MYYFLFDINNMLGCARWWEC